MPVRGYVSCVTDCPYDGPTPPDKAAEVADALFSMGCYEISLGDTIGRGTPETISAMLEAVLKNVAAAKLAGHYHDTGNRALDNIAASIEFGLRVFDASAGGLGGCPFAPGAKGNVATGAVVELLESRGFATGIDRQQLAVASEFARSLRKTRAMTWQTVNVQIDARGVALLELAQPEKRNALSARMIAELAEAANWLASDSAVRAVVLAGSGKTFCAGGDLSWMQAQIAADRETRMREARKLAMMLQTLNTMARPLIGRVHGDAFGGGVGLMCVCDTVAACDAAKFGFTETRLGLIPATIGPYVVARLGEGMARRVFMSARIFDAAEACRIGLVAEVVPQDQLDAAVERQVRPYLSAAPGAVGAAKSLARFLGPRIDEATIEETIRRLADTWETAEASQGIAAFFAKRPAPWAND